MSCKVWKEKLDAYIDSELPPDEMSWCAEHLKSCPGCASESLSRMQLKRMTQLAGKKFVASPEFRARIRHQIAGRTKRGFLWNWVPIAAVAATLVLAAVLSMNQIARSEKQQTISELTDLHVANLASTNPVDVVSSDRHTVKPWFQGKLPFTFNLPELANTQFTLIGGRIAYFHQSPGAHLLYEIRKHKISVLILQDRPELGKAIDPSLAAKNPSSFVTTTWTANGLRFYLITDAGLPDAKSLQQLFLSDRQI